MGLGHLSPLVQVSDEEMAQAKKAWLASLGECCIPQFSTKTAVAKQSHKLICK